jgi:hypothetical protein
MVVHARGEGPLAVAGHRVRGHREDRQLLAAGQGADPPGGLEAVHPRHLQVHQHEGVVVLLHAPHALLAVRREVDLDVRRAEQLDRDLLVELVVLHEQDARPAQPVEIGGGLGRGDQRRPRDRGGLARESADRGVEEQRRAHRLDEHAFELCAFRFVEHFFAVVGGHDDAARLRLERHRLHSAGRLDAVQVCVSQEGDRVGSEAASAA